MYWLYEVYKPRARGARAASPRVRGPRGSDLEGGRIFSRMIQERDAPRTDLRPRRRRQRARLEVPDGATSPRILREGLARARRDSRGEGSAGE